MASVLTIGSIRRPQPIARRKDPLVRVLRKGLETISDDELEQLEADMVRYLSGEAASALLAQFMGPQERTAA